MISYIPAVEHENDMTYQWEDERDMNIYEDIELVGELKIYSDLKNGAALNMVTV